MNRTRALGAGCVTAYIGTVLIANWATTRYGLIPVGFGLQVTAGTYAAGLALGLRDGIQDTLGRRWVVTAILVGAALSFAVASGRIAVASGVAFLLAEFCDWAVYTPLRGRGFTLAVIASNAAGALVDTVAFLTIAGFPVTGRQILGQLVGKGWATLAFLLIAWGVTRAVPVRHRQPADA